jgi:hypothetical protein
MAEIVMDGPLPALDDTRNLQTLIAVTFHPLGWWRQGRLYDGLPAGAVPETRTGPASMAGPVRTIVGQPCLASLKIRSTSSILSSSCWATSGSREPLVPLAPASLVASFTSVCSSGYFSKCGGLK